MGDNESLTSPLIHQLFLALRPVATRSFDKLRKGVEGNDEPLTFILNLLAIRINYSGPSVPKKTKSL